MPIGTSKVGALGGLVPGGTETFNASGTFCVPPGVKIVSFEGAGGAGNPGNPGNPGNAGTFGSGGSGGGGGGGSFTSAPLRSSNPNANAGGRAIIRGNAFNPGGCPPRYIPGGAGGTSPWPGSGNPGGSGQAGQAGQAGNAGTTGQAGQCGQASSAPTLCLTFPGGAGGNAGAAGNAGTAGAAGNGGAGGNGGTTSNAGTGGAGGTAAGPGGNASNSPSATRRINPTLLSYDGGEGGGGASSVASGGTGRSHNPFPFSPAPQPGVPSLGITGTGGLVPTASCQAPPLRVPLPCQGGNPLAYPWGPPTRWGGTGQSTFFCVQQPVLDVWTSQNTYPYAPQLSATNEVWRSGSGGGSGTKSLAPTGIPVYVAGTYTFNTGRGTGGGGGGGGGRGAAGGAGGTQVAGGCGNPANPTTFNCVSVTPGGSVPITVACGGSVTITWNPQ